jgi:hypothetical protein
MRITSTGNVGIGTNSPTKMLSIYEGTSTTLHTIKMGSATSPTNGYMGMWYGQLRITNGTTYNTTSGWVADGAYAPTEIYMSASSNDGFITFGTANSNVATVTERMRITSGGYTKMSNTNSYLSVAGDYHEVRSNSANDTLVLSNTNASGSAYYSEIQPANTTQTHFIGYSSGAYRIFIYSNGDVRNTNNVFGAISDIKLKENIIDATPKLNDLLKVKIRNYNLIGEKTKQIGVIAQELEEIFPSMIDESEDFEKVEVTDEDGNITTEKKSLGTKTKSVKYSIFVPMLIKAIQEQNETITKQGIQIEELKQLINK